MASKREQRISEFVKPFRVKPGSRVVLAKHFDPASTQGVEGKKQSKELLTNGIDLLADLQSRLWAQDTDGVLIVLQAMDAAGKDGTIRHVMSGVNPQGVRVSSFKAPSAVELDHDYLWRYAQKLPERGQIAIFNRSHYEEVLVVRVHQDLLKHQKLPRNVRGAGIWKRRFREINDWERYLTDNGIKVVKVFLNLSKEQQRIRFLRRIDLPDHNWKFSTADVRERQCWDDYQKAFSEMLSNTSTEWAPWHVIPADHKWYARLASGAVIAQALMEINPQFPKVTQETRQNLQQIKQELEAEAPAGAAPDPFEEDESSG
jgi:PPK2 family polyphosphate:nucleotide phosphotransferase